MFWIHSPVGISAVVQGSNSSSSSIPPNVISPLPAYTSTLRLKVKLTDLSAILPSIYSESSTLGIVLFVTTPSSRTIPLLQSLGANLRKREG